MRYDMILCGGAGQGVVTMAKVLSVASMREGFDCRSVAYFGIAKTEGPVWAHMRIGTPAGPSPKIRRGRADMLVGMDRLEALRHGVFLARGGCVLLDETGMPPVYSQLLHDGYPTKEEVEAAFEGSRIKWIPTMALSLKAGSSRLSGAVMLGAVAAVSGKLDRDQLVLSLREEMPEMADNEAEAFYLGYGFVTGKDM